MLLRPLRTSIALLTLAGSVHAASFQWNQTAAGTTYDWNVPANWTPGTDFPDAVGDVANFTADLLGAQTIRLQEDITIGTLNIGDPATAFFAYTIANEAGDTFALTFDNAGGSSARLAKNLTVSGGATDVISAPIVLNDTLLLDVRSTVTSTATVTLSGAMTGAFPIVKMGAGGTVNLTGSANDATSLTIAGERPTSGTNRGTFTVGSVSSGAFNNTRISDSAAINLAGGVLTFIGVNSGATTEDVGTVNVRASHSTLQAQRGLTTGSIVLTADALVRDASRGTLSLNTSTQTNLGNTTADSFARIVFGTAPTAQLVGSGGTEGNTNLSILPYALGPLYTATNGPTGSIDSFVTYSAVDGAGFDGLRALMEAEYATTINATSDAAGNRANVRPIGGVSVEEDIEAGSVAGIRSINSFMSGMTFSNTYTADLAENSITLEVTSGAIAVGGGGSLIFSGGTVAFGAQEAVISVGGSRAVTISSAITGTGGFTKGGGTGAVTISSVSNTFTGGVVINEGAINTGNNEVIPDANSLVVRAGGTLSIANTRTETVASLAGSGTVTLGGTTAKAVIGTGTAVNNTFVVSSSLSPGDFLPGRLSLDTASTTGGLTLSAGAQVNIDLNSADPFTFDSIGVDNTIDLGAGIATLNLTDSASVALPLNTYFAILENTSVIAATTGFFSGRAGGSTVVLGVNEYRIDYEGDAATGALAGGNDVLLTVVPEPSSAIALLGGLASLVGLQRLRRRRA